MFTLSSATELPSLQATARIYRHDSGLQALCLATSDIENMFSICLPTPAIDNTGVTHILEHTVLAGSRNYPVKDPFMELIKSSMATFINALTYQDYTVYPVATAVPAEFFNLASVYFDAVFNPLLSRDNLAQEGWHYELAKAGDLSSPLLVNGIVLNEMSGDFFDVDSVIEREANACLLDNTPRAFVSGGMPQHIPELTYEKYLEYYRTHYHPSRAKVFFYGSIPDERKLEFLEKQLAALEKRPAPPPLPPRPRLTAWTAPRRKVVPFCPEMEQDSSQGALALAWFLTDRWEPLFNLAFEFIDYLLLGNASAPLRKAIQESGLCESLAISGYDNESPENYFLTAVKGIALDDIPAMEKLIHSTLADIAKKGFTAGELQAAFNSFRLEQLEITSDHVFNQMEKVFDAWAFDMDPLAFLDTSVILPKLESRLRREPGWLGGLIRQYLCDNPHRLTLELHPDEGLAERLRQQQARQLADFKATLSPGQLAAIDAEARKLRTRQGAPNSPKALATLPKLAKNEIPHEPLTLRTSSSRLPNQVELLDVDEFANGLSYLTLAYPVEIFPPHLRHLTGLFQQILPAVGNSQERYDQSIVHWARTGANFSLSANSGFTNHDTSQPSDYLLVRLSAFDTSFPDALALLATRLTDSIFTEKRRLDNVLRQNLSQALEELAYANRYYTNSRASTGLSVPAGHQELWRGIAGLSQQKRTASHFRKEYLAVQRQMEEMAAALATASPVAAAFLGTEQTRRAAVDFLKGLPAHRPSPLPWPDSALPQTNGRRETLAVNTDVAGTARCLKAPLAMQADSGAIAVYANLLSCGYIWDEVRVKGGAYGASANYNHALGILSIQSSQDPTPSRTFGIYDALPDLEFSWTEGEIEQSVIATLRGFHTPVRPSGATNVVLVNHLRGFTTQMRRQWHEEILRLTRNELHAAINRFWQRAPEHNDCAIGPSACLRPLKGETLKI
ncbi:MAG: insulinase family protein [Victivallales bacterium]|nr:insulinase family protein [Victivallales bacterium]